MFPRIVGFRRKIIDLVGIRPIITYCWQKLDFSEILLLLIVRFFRKIGLCRNLHPLRQTAGYAPISSQLFQFHLPQLRKHILEFLHL